MEIPEFKPARTGALALAILASLAATVAFYLRPGMLSILITWCFTIGLAIVVLGRQRPGDLGLRRGLVLLVAMRQGRDDLQAADPILVDLDAAAELEWLAGFRTGFTCTHAAKVAELRDREIARDVDVAEMETVLVRTRDAVADEADRVIGEDSPAMMDP